MARSKIDSYTGNSHPCCIANVFFTKEKKKHTTVAFYTYPQLCTGFFYTLYMGVVYLGSALMLSLLLS